MAELETVFVPFPGDFFSIYRNMAMDKLKDAVFVPFPGDFFSMGWDTE